MPDVFDDTMAVAEALPFDAFEQRLLDVEPFDDRFDDPVARSQAGEVVEASGSNERRASDGEERIGLAAPCARFRPWRRRRG